MEFGVAESDADLQAILGLQAKNLPHAITQAELTAQGFVTLRHTLDLLRKMNTPFPHIVARDQGRICGYALVMRRAFDRELPILIPMFEQINSTHYAGRELGDAQYVVMGQVCIDKPYRGKGLFQGMYAEMARRLADDFDYILTEVSVRNQRSMKAHFKVGFEAVKTYTTEADEWVVLLLDLSPKR